MLRSRAIGLALALALAACGTAPEDRTVSGAGIGAAGGAILGAVTGLTVVEGAALGAVGGALTGVLTDPGRFNLGEPFWRRGDSSGQTWSGAAPAAGPAAASGPGAVAPDSDLIARIQAGLVARGYDPGPVDGLMGPQTAAAIRAYQRENALLSDGRPSTELAEHIQVQAQAQ